MSRVEQRQGHAVSEPEKEIIMLKGGLLWLIGIPLPIILLIFLFTDWL
jgi:hypothetical protein